MAVFAAQHGMHWVGLALSPGWLYTSEGSADDLNRLGGFLGAMAQSPSDLGPDLAPSKRTCAPPSTSAGGSRRRQPNWRGTACARRERRPGLSATGDPDHGNVPIIMGTWPPRREAVLGLSDSPGTVRGGLSTVQLAAAVSNAGGPGSFSAHIVEPDDITTLVAQLKAATSRTFLGEPLGTAAGRDRPPGIRFARHVDRIRPYLAKLGLPDPAATSPSFPTSRPKC